MPDTVAAAAAARLFGAPAVRAGHLAVTASPRVFRLTLANQMVCLRLPDPGIGCKLAPGSEYRNLLQLAAAGLSPGVLGFDADSGAIALAWIDAVPADLPTLSRVLPGALLRLHGLDLELPPFAPADYAAEYARGLSGGAAGQAMRQVDRVAMLARRHAADWAGEDACHHDLHAGNLLLVGDRMLFLDIEYAVRGNGLIDIASFSAMNNLSSVQAWALASRYLAGCGRRAEQPAFTALLEVQLVLAELWNLARSDNNGVSQLTDSKDEDNG